MKYSIIFAAAAVASEVYPTIKDYDHKDCTVTASDQSVLVYHTQYTVTHTESSKYGGYAMPTGAYPASASASGCWYEKYEKMEYAPYNKLGPHAIPGYAGVDDCEEAKETQVVYGKEYKGGKWSSYTATHNYAMPTPYATTYPAAGTYTVPAKECTVDSTSYYAAEATKVYSANEECSYGGKYVSAMSTGYLTVPYAEYETGKPVMKTKTVYASSTGKVEVCKSTVTSYPEAKTIKYATASWYAPGVYHQDAQTVKAESAGHVYTCTYEKVKDFEYKTVTESYPTATPMAPESYKPSYYKPAEESMAYPTAYPTGYKPAETKPYQATPVAEEEDCEESAYPTGAYPTGKPMKPEGEKYPVKPAYTPYPAKPVDSESKYPTGTSPAKAEESDCEEGPEGETKKPYPATYTPYAAASTPYAAAYTPYAAKPVDSEQKPKYDAKPVEGDNKYPTKPTDADSHKPVYSATPADDHKAYEAKPVDSESKKPYAAKPVAGEEDCEEDDKKPVDDKTNGYKAHPRRFAL